MANSPRHNLASRIVESEPSLDEKTAQALVNSLRDRIYQRSFNLRKTFRELDAAGNGFIPIDLFSAEMSRAYNLSSLETKCLRVLLQEADFRRDGAIDFREFCEMLKMRDYDSDAVVSDAHRRRLAGPGVLDPRMQRMMKDGNTPIRVQGGVPTNELGRTNIECPFGVLGDSERMDAVIAAFFTHKTDHLRSVFRAHDADRDGFLTRAEFRVAMKEVDRYVFDDEIDNLIDSLDVKRNGKFLGLIGIEQFVNGLGREYLKKKAHRSNAQANPFVWDVAQVPQPPRTAGSPRGSPRAASKKGSATVLPKAQDTRASELRTQEIKQRIHDLGERRKEDKFYEAALEERRLQLGSARTPRLPLIASGRGASARGPAAPVS